jgi:hypothetical protein
MATPTISHDAAVAAASRILEEFFFVYAEEQVNAVGCRLVVIIQAATEAALELQRKELLKTSSN